MIRTELGTVLDRRFRAVGSSADPVSCDAHISQICALAGVADRRLDPACGGGPVLVEGEEETGSLTLSRFLDAYQGRLHADVVAFADAANWTVDVPSPTTTPRRGTSVIVEAQTLDHGAHSGQYGGPVSDALTALCRMLASLHDERGDVPVSGLVRRTRAQPIRRT